MIRYTLLTLAVVYLAAYAFRDWYKSLCGLLVMMAFIERYDMPRQMLGITGLNPWNLLMAFIMIAWFFSIRREKLEWDVSRNIRNLLIFYLIVIFVGFFRMTDDIGKIAEFYINTNRASVPNLTSLIINDLLNTLKYFIPALLIFHGCNSKSRLAWGIAACLLTSFLLGIQIIKWMPISDLNDGDALSERALRVLDRSIGYHRVDLAAMMASASWAFFVSRVMAPSKGWAWTLTGIGFLLILSLALTGGRAGYVSWAAVAVMLSMLRWKKLILVMPVLIVLVVTLVPAARDRMLQGFGEEARFDAAVIGDGSNDFASITSDRILIWPSVIKAIGDAPLFGYGRHGYHVSGASREIRDLYPVKGQGFPHPHNAYLEILIDNGFIGSLPIFLFFYIVFRRSAEMFKDTTQPLYSTAGGIALAFVVGQLVASIGAQSFYPRAGVVIMWATIGLALRAHIMWQKETAGVPEPVEEPRRPRRATQPWKQNVYGRH